MIPITSLLTTILTATIVSAETGWFWHVTDFHYDFTYNSTDLSCNGDVNIHGKFGDYWCDSPWKLALSGVEAMKTHKPNVDFILWTGDSVLHTSDDHLSLEINDHILGNLTDLLTSTFPGVTVYATFGNHDYFPNNQFPPHGNELYNRTLDRWKHWINDDTQHDYFRKGAYYTVKRPKNLRILALNTNLYYTSNKQTPTIDDPADQFAWMDEVLTNATLSNEKVIITAHIPPGITFPDGKPWFWKQFNTKMNQIIRKHSTVIVGQYFGHEHADNFRVYYVSGKPKLTQFCAPSITPWRYKIANVRTGPAHNPAVRLVQYDRISGEPLNIIQYYMDLPASNKNGTPQWKIEYNAKTDYGLTDLSAKSLDGLITKMFGENSEEFDNHFKWRDVNVAENIRASCDTKCKATVVCSLRNVDQSTYDTCYSTFVGGANSVYANVWILVSLIAIVMIARKIL